jgi:pimeloyl-ACP methyl ester carboxylesterase
MLALERHGRGEPLVLIHGLGATRAIWRRAIPLLGGEVISLDVPGFGASPPVGPGFALDDVADAIAAELPDGFDLVGHSLGGAVALTLASRHADRVRRLVLVAPAGMHAYPELVGNVAGRLSEPLNALRRAGAPLADRAWGRRLLLAAGVSDAKSIPPSEVRMLVRASHGATRIREALAAAAAADLRPLLRALPLPVGAIWGAHDHVVPLRGLAALRECRPEAPVEIVERAGHIPMIERPAAFAAALERVRVHV